MRRLPLSPTLSALARRGRAAFTLVEVLIAMAISMVIVLTAVAAFRVVLSAMDKANTLSVQNGLLRVGFQDSIEDVDFYHSEADDKPPYGKGFTRVRTKVENDPATKESDTRIRRHFQPVRFMRETDPDALPFQSADPAVPEYTMAWDRVVNPGTLLAHDPRSIDRSHLYPNTPPNGGYRFVDPRFVHGDYRLVAATDMRDADPATSPAGAVVKDSTPRLANPKYPVGLPATVPRDMDARFVATTPKITLDIDLLSTVNAPVRTGYNHTIPLLAWQVFNRLSLLGMTEYTSNGYNVFIQDQDGNEPHPNWRSTGAQVYYTSPRGFDNGPGARTSLPGIWWRSARTGTRDVANFLGCNLREGTTWSLPSFPVLAAPIGGENGYDRQNVVLQMIMEGNTTGTDTARYWMGWSGGQNTGDVARNDRHWTSRTVRLPYNLTDGERSMYTAASWLDHGGMMTPHYQPKALDLETKPGKYPLLTTTIMRYHRLGGIGSVTVTTSAIEDQITGTRIELVCVPLGTSFRGARQHWRLYSPGYAEPNAIGDFYDDAPGPFHAP